MIKKGEVAICCVVEVTQGETHISFSFLIFCHKNLKGSHPIILLHGCVFLNLPPLQVKIQALSSLKDAPIET